MNNLEGLADITLDNCAGWKWIGPGKTSEWTFPNKVLISRLRSQIAVDPTKLNRRWGQLKTAPQWEILSKHLWKGWTFPKVRFFLWRLLQHGFFTNGRAHKWGVSDGMCTRLGTILSIQNTSSSTVGLVRLDGRSLLTSLTAAHTSAWDLDPSFLRLRTPCLQEKESCSDDSADGDVHGFME